jgi:hypothetical protein
MYECHKGIGAPAISWHPRGKFRCREHQKRDTLDNTGLIAMPQDGLAVYQTL